MFGAVADKINDIIESIIVYIVESIMYPFENLSSLKNLVFGLHGDGKLVWGTFKPEDLTDVLAPAFYTVAVLAGFFLVAFIALYGARVSGAAVNPSKRNELIWFLLDLGIVMIVLLNLTTFYDLLFQANKAVVTLFSGAHSENIDNLKEMQFEDNGGVIGFVLVQLVLLGLAIWANFYYYMRKVTLIILMALGPLMMIFYLNPKFKPITLTWVKELIGSVAVQSIHAFTFWIVAMLSASEEGLIETVILYVIFIPLAESLRSLIGLGGGMQGNLSKAGAMLGLAGIAGMAGAVKGAFGDKSVMGAMKGMYNGAKDRVNGKDVNGDPKDAKGSIGANAGSDIGSSVRGEKMLRAGDIMSKMGKAVLGASGAVAGMALGPVGTIVGASAGSEIGGVVGGIAGRGAAAGTQALGKVGKNMVNAAKDGHSAGKDALNQKNKDFEGSLAESIADNETANWASENKDKAMARLKEKFPDASPKELESKFNNLLDKKKADFLGQARKNVEAIKANGEGLANGNKMVDASSSAMADQWAKDNQESFFKEYDKENLKAGGQQTPEYLAKRQKAFNQKKKEAGEQWAKSNQQSFNADYDKENLKEDGHTPEYLANRQKAFEQKKNEMGEKWAKSNQQSFNADYDKSAMKSAGGQTPEYLAKRQEAFNQKKNEVGEQWAKSNQQSFNADYDKQHLKGGESATPEYVAKRQSAFNQKKNEVGEQWAKSNQQSFNEDYDNANLQGSSNGYTADYLAKRTNAFNQKKAQMKTAFAQVGNDYVSSQAVDGNEPISKEGFQTHLSKAIPSLKNVGNATSLLQAGNNAVNHTTGANILDDSGKPNASFIVGQLAKTKTEQMGEQYVQKQMDSGVSREAATNDWISNHQKPAHTRNVQAFQQSLNQASDGIQFNANPEVLSSWLSNGGTYASSFVPKFLAKASGISAISDGVSSLKEVAVSAGQGASVGFMSAEGTNVIKRVANAATGGWQSGTMQLADNMGGSVQAESRLQNIAGYTAGVVMGQKGYQVGKKAALALSPFNSQVQDTISTPSEVIQMARTVTDANGNKQIAPGAIRQVITKDASYIEVQTKSGETQVVSRQGAGHSTLKNGEVVYQDLQAVDDSLVVAKPKSGQSSTYRLDSGGARIPSRVAVTQNPTTLLSDSVYGSTKAAPVQKAQVPVYNHQVDQGNFAIEDLKGMEQVQVVVEKDRQYVTAQKDGTTYRVSPVYAGDTRLGQTETVTIPVQASGSRLQPQYVDNSAYGVETTSDSSYYSSNSVEGLIVGVEEMMESKHSGPVNKRLEKRKYLDEVRRKQGLLG